MPKYLIYIWHTFDNYLIVAFNMCNFFYIVMPDKKTMWKTRGIYLCLYNSLQLN